MVTWESSLVGTSSDGLFIRKWRRLVLEMLDKKSHFRKNQNNTALKILQILSKFKNLELISLRFLITRLLPFNPLQEEPQDLEIFIFTSRKDLEILPLSIIGSSQCHAGKITKITVIHPGIIQKDVSAILNSLAPTNLPLSQMSDEQLLSTYALPDNSFARGNIKMEVVKLITALESKERFSLLIDGDTVLLKPRNWATAKNYLLLVAQEYTRAHIKYNQGVIDNYVSPGLGFVTHHQLIKTENIRDLVATFGGINLLAASFEESSSNFYTKSGNEFPSEWQLIGDFQSLKNFPAIRLANFSNLGLSRSKLLFLFTKSSELTSLQKELDLLRKKTPGLGSISFHLYKD